MIQNVWPSISQWSLGKLHPNFANYVSFSGGTMCYLSERERTKAYLFVCLSVLMIFHHLGGANKQLGYNAITKLASLRINTEAWTVIFTEQLLCNVHFQSISYSAILSFGLTYWTLILCLNLTNIAQNANTKWEHHLTTNFVWFTQLNADYLWPNRQQSPIGISQELMSWSIYGLH